MYIYFPRCVEDVSKSADEEINLRCETMRGARCVNHAPNFGISKYSGHLELGISAMNANSVCFPGGEYAASNGVHHVCNAIAVFLQIFRLSVIARLRSSS